MCIRDRHLGRLYPCICMCHYRRAKSCLIRKNSSGNSHTDCLPHTVSCKSSHYRTQTECLSEYQRKSRRYLLPKDKKYSQSSAQISACHNRNQFLCKSCDSFNPACKRHCHQYHTNTAGCKGLYVKRIPQPLRHGISLRGV